MNDPQFLRRTVEIDERWEKIDGVVYRLYRFTPETQWRFEETFHKEIPVVIVNLRSPEDKK
jgi:hypothetical protein